MTKAKPGKTIGIDLGTTFSAVAVMEAGKATIIPSAEGDRTTPSVVTIKDGERLVGKLARNSYVSFNTEREITNFPLAKLEEDIIGFYNEYFEGKLSDTFEELQTTIDKLL